MSFKTLSVVALAAATLGLCSAAYADSSTGFYVGGQAGYGQTDYNAPSGFSSDQDGIAGRAYAGYQFNQYFGLETGYSAFSDAKFDSQLTVLSNTIVAHAKAQTEQWDILAKVGMPFGCSGFRGDIKAGGAYVMSKTDWSVTNSPDFANFNRSGSDSENNWDPVAGASVSYNFNKNFAVDVSYLHTFGSSSNFHFRGNNNPSPDTDLATVGVSYLFA